MDKPGRPNASRRLSRRRFLALAITAAASGAAAGGLLNGCRADQAGVPVTPEVPEVTSQPVNTPDSVDPTTIATALPTVTPEPTTTVVPTTTPMASPTPVSEDETRQPNLLVRAPYGVSRVVRARHAGVWDGETLSPDSLRHMVASSVMTLTGFDDARAAWAALFGPDERIAIKVNAFRNSRIWTHVPLVTAVTDALQDAGIPAENILIFDYLTSELEKAGFALNREGPGVRCYGTDSSYTGGFEIVGIPIELSDCVLSSHALINMPVLKSHMIAGLTFALKNHYGTLRTPQQFHSGTRINQGMGELNNLAPIKDRTRLVIGDALTACLRYRNSYPYWEPDTIGDTVTMSFDPVATDAVALDILTSLMRENDMSTDFAFSRAAPWLEHATEIGLGTHHLEEIDLHELVL
jgi:uncharacterized protein (DUF362 family)